MKRLVFGFAACVFALVAIQFWPKVPPPPTFHRLTNDLTRVQYPPDQKLTQVIDWVGMTDGCKPIRVKVKVTMTYEQKRGPIDGAVRTYWEERIEGRVPAKFRAWFLMYSIEPGEQDLLYRRRQFFPFQPEFPTELGGYCAMQASMS